MMNNYPAKKGSQHMADQVLKKEFCGRLVMQMGQNMAIHHTKNSDLFTNTFPREAGVHTCSDLLF